MTSSSQDGPVTSMVENEDASGLVLGPFGLCHPEVAKEQAARFMTNVAWSDEVAFSPRGRHLVKNVLPSRGLAFLYGPSFTGKTFVAHEIGLAVALGTKLADKYRVQPGLVVYLALEDEAGVKDRHIAFKVAHGVTNAKFAFLSHRLRLADPQSVNDLVKILKVIAWWAKEPIVLLAIDPLAHAMAELDENRVQDAHVAISALAQISEAIDGLVLTVHHTGKNAFAGMRGSSAFFAAADAVLAIGGSPSEKQHALRVEKLKNGETLTVAGYAIERFPMGHDEDGEEVSVGLLRWTTDIPEAREISLSPALQALLRHLRSMVDEAGSSAEAEVVAVHEEELIKRAVEAGDVSKAPEPRNARTVVQAAMQKLEKLDLIGREGGTVWLVASNAISP